MTTTPRSTAELLEAHQTADAAHVRCVQQGMALRDAFSYGDTVARKVTESRIGGSLVILSRGLLSAISEAQDRNAAEQARLAAAATASYRLWVKAEQDSGQ
jgi:hypothetical protein